jgi:hypothetical protein
MPRILSRRREIRKNNRRYRKKSKSVRRNSKKRISKGGTRTNVNSYNPSKYYKTTAHMLTYLFLRHLPREVSKGLYTGGEYDKITQYMVVYIYKIPINTEMFGKINDTLEHNQQRFIDIIKSEISIDDKLQQVHEMLDEIILPINVTTRCHLCGRNAPTGVCPPEEQEFCEHVRGRRLGH